MNILGNENHLASRDISDSMKNMVNVNVLDTWHFHVMDIHDTPGGQNLANHLCG